MKVLVLISFLLLSSFANSKENSYEVLDRTVKSESPWMGDYIDAIELQQNNNNEAAINLFEKQLREIVHSQQDFGRVYVRYIAAIEEVEDFERPVEFFDSLLFSYPDYLWVRSSRDYSKYMLLRSRTISDFYVSKLVSPADAEWRSLLHKMLGATLAWGEPDERENKKQLILNKISNIQLRGLVKDLRDIRYSHVNTDDKKYSLIEEKRELEKNLILGELIEAAKSVAKISFINSTLKQGDDKIFDWLVQLQSSQIPDNHNLEFLKNYFETRKKLAQLGANYTEIISSYQSELDNSTLIKLQVSYISYNSFYGSHFRSLRTLNDWMSQSTNKHEERVIYHHIDMVNKWSEQGDYTPGNLTRKSKHINLDQHDYLGVSPMNTGRGPGQFCGGGRGGRLGFGGLSQASNYGIQPYGQLRYQLKGTGIQSHHLLEKRFAPMLGLNANRMSSAAVTPSEHQVFTNAWRAYFPYGTGTQRATPDSLRRAINNIYSDYPALKNAALADLNSAK